MALTQFKLDNGSTVLVEIDENLIQGGEAPAGVGAPWIKAKTAFSQAMQTIAPVLDEVAACFDAIATKPEEYEVEFGIKLSASLDAIIAKGEGEGEANFKVKMKWKASE
ncbi:CU044_2847 family protein [Paraburkholderia sp. BL25I1N1]|uniref:CU044_2847 family protein n=1 Tax=Paraburkholderia sp. BL25I1N1 TaxID=1938804 RepID=UPI000D07BCC1|nr:CU044_2847 family protein [Paraburkholderia sp. BL25I1N1]PRY03194.1 hypothetical protein B0G73_11647 [Paraburkholderia sp. BL25I1N1]